LPRENYRVKLAGRNPATARMDVDLPRNSNYSMPRHAEEIDRDHLNAPIIRRKASLNSWTACPICSITQPLTPKGAK